MTTAAPKSPSLPASGWCVVALAGILIAAFCVHLWPEWLHNPDLSHGLFTPVLFLLLLHESRRQRPPFYPTESRGLALARGALLVIGVGFTLIAALYAAGIDWSHALVGMTLALALSALLLAALLWLSTNRVRALPLNWTSLVAAGFWPLCAPIPPGTYSRLTLQLQFWVTDIVLNSLHLLGIAASKSGNIILLAHTSVGVEEACSGVRSLLSCVVAAIFFSATLVRRPWARVLLIVLAPPLAFAMNIARSLGLTLMANAGIDISGKWHDLTGFAVLGVTALILGGLALLLEEKTPVSWPIGCDTRLNSPAIARASRPWGLLAAYLLVVALIGLAAFNTRRVTQPSAPAPDLEAVLPANAPGWDTVHTESLVRFAPVLETDHLIQRTYVRRVDVRPDGEPLQITVYLAYWSPGQVPVSLVAAHTPEACWPSGGWSAQPVTAAEQPFLAGDRALPAPEFRAFTHNGFLQNVWYWHLYDGRSIAQTDPRSAVMLLKLAWRYGFRTAGEQMFVRISSNRPWAEIRDDPLVTGILARLQPHGL